MRGFSGQISSYAAYSQVVYQKKEHEKRIQHMDNLQHPNPWGHGRGGVVWIGVIVIVSIKVLLLF